jgi:protein involved in polysaccharide export with SLBB domain
MAIAAGVSAVTLSGCSAITQPIDAIPAKRVPPAFFAEPKNELVPVDVSLLALEPPRDYLISGGDILGVYIEGVLPFNPPNAPPEPPPVNFPEQDSPLPPSIGYPIAVQDDGTLSLPLLEPIDVDGLTLEQVRDAIREAYIDNDILRPEKARPIVTIIREREYDVIVLREDSGGGGGGTGLSVQSAAAGLFRGGSEQAGRGGLVKLKAYQNDVLHALVETGGLPGLNAKNEVQILRVNEADKRKRQQFLQQFYAYQRAVMLDPCACPPALPPDPSILRIPLRLPPGVVPEIAKEDIELNDGDIIYIESREAEVFYTGGLLPGREIPLPRDYDLDALGAMALAGVGTFQGGNNRVGGFGGVAVSQVPPSRLFILRETDCNGQIAIEVDVVAAINDPRQNPLIQAGDKLILQYSCEEELINFGISTFFTFGIRELFRN